ncbi:MAG TPA: SBBP repeat-containing protein, partial [Anaerolineales bacterium]|nr:SBBP repeat-containing protein [Anaerolineales bacterium]
YSQVPVWGGIRYVDIYPGMDLEITSEQDHLVWEFLVTDASRFYDKNNQVAQQGIRIKIAGHQELQVQNNALDIATDVGTLALPVIRLDGAEQTLQIDPNGEIIVPLPNQISQSPNLFRSVNYIIPKETHQNELDSSQPNSLPQTVNTMPLSAPEDLLLYSTFLGGSAGDTGVSLVVGQDQMIYIGGETSSTDFPEAPGMFQGIRSGAYVAKIDILNSLLVYVAFLSNADLADIAVDSSSNVYMTGIANDGFTTTPGVLDSVWDWDSFVTKINASGTGLIYSTLLGGSHTLGYYSEATQATSIEVDNNGFAYVTGGTLDNVFATTPVGYDQSYNGEWDVFVTKINPAATQQEYFTYVGGSTSEFTSDLVLDETGAVYITGNTDSGNFPTTPEAYDPVFASPDDVFVVKLNPTGTTRVYSTLLGGAGGEDSYGLAVDNSGSAYVALETGDFPITFTIGPDNDPNNDALIVKLDPSGSNRLFSTHISDDGWLADVSLDQQGSIYVIGSSSAHGEQTSPGSYDPIGNRGDPSCQGSYLWQCFDVFIQKLTPSGDSLAYGSYFGGTNADFGREVVADNEGNIIFLVLDTISSDFPLTPDAIDSTLGVGLSGSGDAALVKMSTNLSETVQIEITDSAGNPVSALSLNSEGWPTPNPLTVTVTLSCPTGGLDCNYYPFNFNLSSNNSIARLFVYDSTRPPDGGNCIGDYPNVAYTLESFELSCSDISLYAGESVSYVWKLWVQPSNAAQLDVQAAYSAFSKEKTISIPKAAIHPVAIIPGFFGSNVTFTKRVYDPLIDTFERMGYQLDQTLFVAEYDPVGDIADAALQLSNSLVEWQGVSREVDWVDKYPTTEEGYFDLIAHSQGALVARTYAEIGAYPVDLHRLLLVGGPNKGVLYSYPAREGLQSDIGLYQVGLDFLLPLYAYNCGHVSVVGPNPHGGPPVPYPTTADLYATFHDPNCGLLGVPQLFPAPGPNDPTYLFDANGDYPYGRQHNPLLENAPANPIDDPWWSTTNPNPTTTYLNLNSTANLDLLRDRLGGFGNLYVLYNDTLDAQARYRVSSNSAAAPLWRNGDVVQRLQSSGDGSVATYSARPLDLWSGAQEQNLDAPLNSIPEKHANLLVYPESQVTIAQILTGLTVPFTTSLNSLNYLAQAEDWKALFFTGMSPIELLITDPAGRRLGYDSTTGQILDEIPLGVYQHPIGGTADLWIFDPLPGNYSFTTVGTGTGSYTILAQFVDSNASVPVFFDSNNIQPGEVRTNPLVVPQASSEVPYPPDVNAGIDISTVVGTPVQFSGTIKDINPNETFNIQWDFGDGSTASATQTPSHTYTAPGIYTVILTVTDSTGFTVSDTLLVTVTPTQSLYLSLNNSATVGGVAAQDVDILSFNSTTWSMLFDGSDVGINTSTQDLNEFHLLDADSILLTFDAPITLGTLAADPWDVVRFDATSLGDSTTGTFSLYFDGNDVELDTTAEYLDGLDVLPDGRVLISTTGNPSVSGVTGEVDEDILAFTPITLGAVTSGTWSMYFDGSDVGLADTGDEDVDALAVRSNGDIFLSTSGNFAVTGISGADEDVFICTPTSLGNTTACNYSPLLYFDGNVYGLDANDVDGIELTVP